jgi:PAS domain S-box-containing protein
MTVYEQSGWAETAKNELGIAATVKVLDITADIQPVYETWRNALHPEDREAAETLLHNAALGKAAFDTEFRDLLSDGSVRHIRAAAKVERDAEGKPKSITGLNWDISENKQTELTLKASEEQVRLLLDSTGEAIYDIDLEGRCTFANPSCAKLLGYTNTELLIGKNMHDLIHHSYPDGSPMRGKGRPMHVDDEVLWRSDGSSFQTEYWSYPQIARGAVQGAVVAFVDITERKEAEKIIKHMATHDGLTDLPRMRRTSSSWRIKRCTRLKREARTVSASPWATPAEPRERLGLGE